MFVRNQRCLNTGAKLITCIFRYGHVYKLAQQQKKGVDSVEGVEGILYQVKLNSLQLSKQCQRAILSSVGVMSGLSSMSNWQIIDCNCPCQVPEILPPEVLEKMHAPPKPDVPILDVHDLPNADGFIFGFPTRYLLAQKPNL